MCTQSISQRQNHNYNYNNGFGINCKSAGPTIDCVLYNGYCVMQISGLTSGEQ